MIPWNRQFTLVEIHLRNTLGKTLSSSFFELSNGDTWLTSLEKGVLNLLSAGTVEDVTVHLTLRMFPRHNKPMYLLYKPKNLQCIISNRYSFKQKKHTEATLALPAITLGPSPPSCPGNLNRFQFRIGKKLQAAQEHAPTNNRFCQISDYRI